MTEQLKNLSPAGMNGGKDQMDKYLPFLEKIFGANQGQTEDFLDKLEREMGRYQRLQSIFGVVKHRSRRPCSISPRKP